MFFGWVDSSRAFYASSVAVRLPKCCMQRCCYQYRKRFSVRFTYIQLITWLKTGRLSIGVYCNFYDNCERRRIMSSFNLTELSDQLKGTNQTHGITGVSFAQQSLKLDTEDDAKKVVEEILACPFLEYLDLAGNTLGPEAAKAIAEALSKNGASFKRALWKDMFTGRLKTEIPKALEYLGNGLCTAKASLVELDLSDNAFGPIGVEGLAKFLTSSTCYTLRELRLNNNGLGISGGKILAKALLDCHENSLKEGVPLQLKVFVAGRNRLENEGATALASVFKKLKSLEEVVMPQNGIYHVGIAALADGLAHNANLRILNLNDNTVGKKGAHALAKALPNFQCLERLNLGDCLLKTQGGLVLAEALAIKGNHPSLIELNLGFNEICARCADPIAKAVADKKCLETLVLNGNAFGTEGREILRESLTNFDRINSLGALDEDASDDDEDDETESEHDESDENDKTDTEDITENNDKEVGETVENFLKSPTGEKLLLLHSNAQDFVEYAKNKANDGDISPTVKFIDRFTRIIMKVSALCSSGYVDVRIKAESLTDALYAELFSYSVKNNQISSLNNALLVNLGLIKGEDKNAGKIDWNLEGCFKALEKVCQREYFLPQTKNTLKVFLEKPLKVNRSKVSDTFQESKTSLKNVLSGTRT